MKKTLLLITLAATGMFAEGISSAVAQSVAQQAQKEVQKAAVEQAKEKVAKVGGEEAGKIASEVTKGADSSTLKEKAIDAAADTVKKKTGVEKSLTKRAIKSVL